MISEEKPRENIVFKDLDFLERRKTIRVKPDLKQKLLKQLQVDCDVSINENHLLTRSSG